jgi:hypothetical protein
VKRQRHAESGSLEELPEHEIAELFEDVIPCGIDSEGNEVSPETYVTAHFQHDTEKSERILDEIRDDANDEQMGAYLKWYESKTGTIGMLKRDSTEPDIFYEHVAGPHCIEYCGYDGNAITAEEMKYCHTVQFIAQYGIDCWHGRSDDWPLEADDEDFERRGEYHLTGLGDRSANYEDDDCSVYPKRHGCHEVNPMVLEGFDHGHPPFHPYCLEIYRRVSGLRHGRADLAEVAEWIERRDSNKFMGESKPPHHPAVSRGAEQWWAHEAGHKFLVADPLNVPRMSILFEAARRPEPDFDVKGSPFGERLGRSATASDLFGRLPEELRDMVLVDLGSQDIANLRIASRSFRLLSYTLWHDLMKKEMPWIWEAWTDRPYPRVSRTTKLELIAHDQSIQSRVQAAAALPWGTEERTIQEERIAHDEVEFRKSLRVEQLDRLHTDWYYLYCQLRRDWKNIKGLQNRERIWKAAGFVARRIAKPSEDLRVAEQEHAKVFPYQDLDSKEDINPNEAPHIVWPFADKHDFTG